MNKYQEFTNSIKEIPDKKMVAEAKVEKIKALIAKDEVAYGIAELTGEPTERIKKKLDDLAAELKDANRTLSVLTKEPAELIALLKEKKSLVNLAQDILKDNLESITDLQKEYDEKAEQARVLERQFLDVVAAMGDLQKKATALSAESNKVRQYIPGLEKTFFGGLVERINFVRHEGPIYIQLKDSEKAYKDGLNE